MIQLGLGFVVATVTLSTISSNFSDGALPLTSDESLAYSTTEFFSVPWLAQAFWITGALSLYPSPILMDQVLSDPHCIPPILWAGAGEMLCCPGSACCRQVF